MTRCCWTVFAGRCSLDAVQTRVASIRQNGGVFELTDYYISREVMQTLMEDCGLQQVRWPQPVLAPEGVEALGADYWTAIMATPPFCLIEATRA